MQRCYCPQQGGVGELSEHELAATISGESREAAAVSKALVRCR